jgi:3-methyladenine DNA glycosylase AlkD
MQAYMKSAMPYYGVTSPAQKLIFKSVFAANRLNSSVEWRDAVIAVWRGARHREERYAAIALAGERSYRAYQRPEMLPVYEEMIVTGAWWDLVDTVAIHRVGGLLRRDPATVRPAVLAWACDGDTWKRRRAVLSQNGHKDATDEALLYACVIC